MDVIRGFNVAANISEAQQKHFAHETKYALLGAVLFILFTIPGSGSLIKGIFPIAKGPMIIIYKVLLFVAIYYIIQKTKWFQEI